MLKRLSAILLWLAALGCGAVDLTALEVEVKLHPADYRGLLDRFLSADTTLTPQELAKVYYGYSCTPEYDPRYDYADIHAACDSGLYADAERMALDALEVNPVSLDLNVALLTAADKLRGEGGRGRMLMEFGLKCDQMATAILESGRGTSARSPFVVIYSSDIDRILHNVLGVERVIDRTKVGPVDAIKVTFAGQDRTHILYFDNTREERFLSTRPPLKN